MSKMPAIGKELYDHYALMSAQTHEALVKEYARYAVNIALSNVPRGAIKAADAARVPGAEVEPVAWLIDNPTNWIESKDLSFSDLTKADRKAGFTSKPLYTTPPAPQPTDREKVLEEIAAERARQITGEGWTVDHDDTHSRGELARSAACYALQAAQRSDETPYADLDGRKRWRRTDLAIKRFWPWGWGWWKPRDARHDLIRAAALIIAEIERLDRAALAGGEA